jgi:ribosomal protein S18 acetylase RimI-like enzyme
MPSVRAARASDAPAIARVLVDSWRSTYGGIIAQSYIDGMSVESQTKRWQRRLSEPKVLATTVVVDDDGGVVVGFAAGGPIRERCDDFDAELYAIYVAADAQGRGLGRQLLTEWARRASSQGFRAAIVRVLTANSARAFYERLGGRWLKEATLDLDGAAYAESWYGWDSLDALTAYEEL